MKKRETYESLIGAVEEDRLLDAILEVLLDIRDQLQSVIPDPDSQPMTGRTED